MKRFKGLLLGNGEEAHNDSLTLAKTKTNGNSTYMHIRPSSSINLNLRTKLGEWAADRFNIKNVSIISTTHGEICIILSTVSYIK